MFWAFEICWVYTKQIMLYKHTARYVWGLGEQLHIEIIVFGGEFMQLIKEELGLLGAQMFRFFMECFPPNLS